MSERPLPAKNPCASCPYRRDVPAALWHPDEYSKLPEYDNPTAEQPTGVFMCHQQSGRLCAGWVGCHDMKESLAVRLSVAMGRLTPDQAQALVEYTTETPLFPNGAHASIHGLTDIESPQHRAIEAIKKLERAREARLRNNPARPVSESGSSPE